MNNCAHASQDSLVEAVKEYMLKVPGVEDVFILTDTDKDIVEQLEEAAKGNVLMGMGEGDNQGIAEVFKREHILCFTTNKEYVWPEPPNVIMMQGNEVIGFDFDERDVAKYQNNPEYVVMGNFVICKAKGGGKAGKPIVVLPPKPCDLGNIAAKDAVLGSPSTPSDEYIRKTYDYEISVEKGTFFLGFNDA
ncbi:MAG: hypothetical protein FWE54_02720 [Methanimicrococcus sp.]|nr:hypothetical protein [Methanimicrococcus sp.]